MTLFRKSFLVSAIIGGFTCAPLLAADDPRPGNLPPEIQVRIQTEMVRFEVFKNYLEIIERLVRISKDPNACGVAAALGAGELAKTKGTDAAIAFLTTTLKDVKNETVQRAIRFQLAELYRNSGQTDKALEQLQILMTSVAAEAKQQ